MDETIEKINSKALGSNYTRSKIKDKAADMVVGLDKDDIKDYNAESSKKNKILNRVYKRYTRKYNNDKFLGLPYSEVLKLSPKEQERWFAAKNTQAAGPIFSGMAAVAGLPILAGDLAAAPVLTTAGLVNGLVGGYIGNTIGGKIDERRHNLTNNKFVGEMVCGAVGSANIAASNIAPKVTDYRISDFYTKGPKSNIKVNISFGDNTPFYNTPNYQGIETNYDIGLLKSLADVNGYKPAWMTPEQRLMASQQIRSGIQSADRFINSKAVQDAVAHNEALAKRTKFNTSNSNILERPRLPETISVDLRSNIDNPKTWGVFYRDKDYWLNRDPDKGLIVINTAPNQNISSSVFHEVDHAAGYVGSNGANDLAANNFLKWKIKKALKPVSELSKDQLQNYQYITTVGNHASEAYPIFAQIGREVGLKPGQKGTYQDYLNAVQLANERIPSHAKYLELINPKKWYRCWDLLTGQYKHGGKVEQCKQLLKQLNND